jgi:hypothetical protein
MNKKEKLKILRDKLVALDKRKTSLPVDEELETLVKQEVANLTLKLKENQTAKVLAKLTDDLAKFKKDFNLTPMIESVKNFQQEFKKQKQALLTEFETRIKAIPKSSDLTQDLTQLKMEFDRKLEAFKIRDDLGWKEDIENLQKQLQDLVDNDIQADKNLHDTLEKKFQKTVDQMRVDILGRIHGGGSMNRNIAVNGNTSVLSRYTDLNLKAGTNVTLASANNDTTKSLDLTITAAGGGTNPLTTKGDVFGYDTAAARIPVGANGTVLTADSTTALGVKWGAVSGTGTVTSVSVVTANGVSGTVATATTTPAITLTLGAITPTTVVASSTISTTQLTATIATGTAPLVITSTTRVANLNVAVAGTADVLTTARTINGTSFDGSANITVTAAAGTLTGTVLNATVVTSSLTSVGTITTGVWNGTTIAVVNGGTGQTSYTNGQLLIGNTTGNTLAKATLTGTTNQVVVTNGTGTITLSLPQDVHTAATPQFARLGLGSAADAAHILLLTGGTVTTDAHLIDSLQTWNAAGVTFTGWKLNITNTASAAASKLVDLQVGASSRFNININGAILGQVTANSTTAVQYNNAAAAAVLTLDTNAPTANTGIVLALQNSTPTNVFTVNIAGQVPTYSARTTAGFGVPPIYASYSTTANTAAVTNAINYTPPATAGRYRMCGLVNVTAWTTPATFTVVVTYTDDSGTARTETLQLIRGSTGAAATAITAIDRWYFILPLFAINNGAVAITLSTSGTFTGSPSYNLSGTLEQLA